MYKRQVEALVEAAAALRADDAARVTAEAARGRFRSVHALSLIHISEPTRPY